MKRLSISLTDTAAIVAAVVKRAPAVYTMNLVGHEAEWVKAAVNQGIDSHLTACFVPDRGDSYVAQRQSGVIGQVRGVELACKVSRDSLPVLVRRLLEMDAPDTPGGDHPMLFASSICGTLEIECV